MAHVEDTGRLAQWEGHLAGGGLLLHEVERHAIVRLRIVVVAHPAPWRTVLRVALLLVALAVSS